MRGDVKNGPEDAVEGGRSTVGGAAPPIPGSRAGLATGETLSTTSRAFNARRRVATPYRRIRAIV